jgi:glycosyltransferase XagB
MTVTGGRAHAAAEVSDASLDQLGWAIDGLRRQWPLRSAARTFTRGQRLGFALAAVLLVVGLVLDPVRTGWAVLTLLLVVYAGTLTLRLVLLARSLGADPSIHIADDVARAFPVDLLPRYTVLVPVYREPEVIGRLLLALGSLDYPADRLEVLLLLEDDDDATLEAAQAAGLPPTVRIVRVPGEGPRTKPKALNYGLGESTGALVAVFDAEDIPEPLQLRRAAIAYHEGPPELACVQARLDYFNPDQNVITRWFTLEYTMWFRHFLPGLVTLGGPIPLGGTSNHFRRDLLLAAGGWDPFNVTEDADLGLRLHRLGHRVGVLDSVTLEEANSDFVNWNKQRSRWYKGYLQTWIVNLRQPRQSIRELGPRGFFLLNVFVGGTPALALLNPVFWTVSGIYFGLRPDFIRDLFPSPLLYASLVVWLVGNFLFVYGFVLAALERDDVHLFWAAVTIPAYFVMMSVAATKAAVQLVVAPSYWEKTQHGLGQPPPPPVILEGALP